MHWYKSTNSFVLLLYMCLWICARARLSWRLIFPFFFYLGFSIVGTIISCSNAMEAFDSLEQPLCDYNESMDALPELWETDSFESVSELDVSSPPRMSSKQTVNYLWTSADSKQTRLRLHKEMYHRHSFKKGYKNVSYGNEVSHEFEIRAKIKYVSWVGWCRHVRVRLVNLEKKRGGNLFPKKNTVDKKKKKKKKSPVITKGGEFCVYSVAFPLTWPNKKYFFSLTFR